MHPGLQARIQPNKVAFQMAGSGDTLTYGELDKQSNQTAHLLRGMGLKPKDGIALLLDNQLPYITICWAAQRSGLYYTPVSILFQQGVGQIVCGLYGFRRFTGSKYGNGLSQLLAPQGDGIDHGGLDLLHQALVIFLYQPNTR